MGRVKFGKIANPPAGWPVQSRQLFWKKPKQRGKISGNRRAGWFAIETGSDRIRRVPVRGRDFGDEFAHEPVAQLVEQRTSVKTGVPRSEDRE